MVEIDVGILELIGSFILPLVVGVVVKQSASSAVKAITLAVGAAITSVVSAAIQADGFVAGEVVAQAILTLVIAVSAYFGIWSPTGVSDSINGKTANFGIGKKVSEDDV